VDLGVHRVPELGQGVAILVPDDSPHEHKVVIGDSDLLIQLKADELSVLFDLDLRSERPTAGVEFRTLAGIPVVDKVVTQEAKGRVVAPARVGVGGAALTIVGVAGDGGDLHDCRRSSELGQRIKEKSASRTGGHHAGEDAEESV
jgi:hypothetical protein